MAVVSMSYLLEAGVHFGHQTKRWNPKMKEYIFTARDDIYIIDLEKTKDCLERAYEEVKTIAENGGKFLFVGTRKQAGEVCLEEATRSNSYYVTERWLGGTLTNFRTIRRRIKRLEEIEEMEKNGTFDLVEKNTDGSYKDGSYALIIDNETNEVTCELITNMPFSILLDMDYTEEQLWPRRRNQRKLTSTGRLLEPYATLSMLRHGNIGPT